MSGAIEPEPVAAASELPRSHVLNDLGRALFARVPDAAFVAGPQGVLTEANAALCQALGYDRDELLGMHLSDLIGPSRADAVDPFDKHRRLVIGDDLGCVLRSKDGSMLPGTLSTVRVDSGETIGIVDALVDHRETDVAPFRLAAIVESSNDAIIAKDLNGIVTDWNAAAESVFGYTEKDMVGQSITMIIPPDRLHEENEILDRIRSGQRVDHFETVRQTKAGERIDVSVTISPIRDASGAIVGASKIARDITPAKAREREIARMARLYDALSQVNQAIVHTKDRDALFARVCEVLVERGGFRMAWFGFHAPDSRRLVPVAACGDTFGYTHGLQIRIDDSPEGHGPAGTSFRTGRPYICNDMFEDAATKPWRDQIRTAGYRASAAFPIREQGAVTGILNVYADQPGFFGDKEIALLEEAAGDVSFALENFSREAERRRAERMAREETDFSDTLIESMPGIVCFLDRDGHWLRWNKSLESVSGYAAGEIRRMHPGDLFSITDKAWPEQDILGVLERSDAPIEAELQTRSGERIPCMLTTTSVEYQGSRCLVCMGFDISRRKEAEAALRELNESLEHQVYARTRELRVALDRAMAADEVKSVFLATMSHELRTPLNSIIGFTGILLRGLVGELNPEQAKQLTMVQNSAHHLLNLINDVLDISKIEAGHLEIHTHSFDLRDLLMRAASSLQPMADRKGLELVVDIPPDLDGMESDQRRVEQIVINLLNNAIKFTEHGSVRLSAGVIDDHRPFPDADPVRAVRLRVADTGVGIAPHHIGALFQPFRQLDAGLARQHEGTGLGLAICRRLADMLHGDISVDSTLDEGSIFSVTLPLKIPVSS